jgi:parvulin-like peptidyl-prolyl isomerase
MNSDLHSLSRAASLLLVACAIAAAGAGAMHAESPAAVVAVVNGEEITTKDLEKRLESLHGKVGEAQRSPMNLERLLFKAVNDVLIGQEARALGLHEEPPVPEAIERNRRRLALSLLEREEITARSAPEDHEVVEIFEERYRRASFHVLTAADLEGAQGILDALREGADLEELAREKSIDPNRERAGLFENVARKDLQPAIADVVFRMDPNEVAGPVQTDLGWSVVVARSFEEPDPEAIEEARPMLRRLVRQRKSAAAREELLSRLRMRHAVSIDQDLADSIEPARRRDGRLTAKSPGPGKVIARIGEEITLSADEYAEALERRWRTIPDEEAARAAAPIILETLVNERLFLAEAYSRGYHELPAVQRALHELETEMLVPKYLESVLADGIEVSEEEKRAHYESVKDQLRRPPRLQLGKITVPTREEAEAVAVALRAGSDLAWLAARHSTDGLRDKGGIEDWSTVRPGTGPLSSSLLESEIGSVLDPVEQDDAWVVYKIVAREEQGLYSYVEVSGNMREAVFGQKFIKVLDQFIKTARSRSEIEIREEVFNTLLLSGNREPEPETGHPGHGGSGLD